MKSTRVEYVLRTVAAQASPCRFAVAHLLRKSGLCRMLSIPMNGYRLRFHPSSLSAALWINPLARSTDHEFLQAYLRPGDVYLDVGANIGSTAIPAWLSMQGSGTVIAFEAHPRTFTYLQDNIRLNGLPSIRLVNCALGTGPGTVTLSDLSSDDQNRVLTTGPGVVVPVHPLDQFTQPLTSVNLLKIDVEGYEKQVLGGASETLAKTNCLYIEISQPHFQAFGYSVDEVFALLEAVGFSLYCRNATSRIIPVEAGFFSTVHDANVFAIRDVGEFLTRTGWSLNADG